MLKNFLAASVVFTLLSGCISEPRDPAFAGAAGINPQAAAKNRISLGLTYLSNGNFSQAKANLDKALNFAPKSENAHFAMAYYYQQVDEFALADEYYKTALKYGPDNPDIINSYGAFLCEQGKYENAKSYFLKAVSSKSYVSTAETYENLAICAVDQGKTNEAIEYFESALNHQPSRGKSLFFLAQLQKQQGNFGEAKKTLWKYDRVSRVSADSLWLSYEIAQGLGDIKTALGYAELMQNMFPDHPNTAKANQQMGKFGPSARVTNKRKTLTPSSEELPTQSSTPQAEVETPVAQSEPAPLSKKTKTLSPPVSGDTDTVIADAGLPADSGANAEMTSDSELVGAERQASSELVTTKTDDVVSDNLVSDDIALTPEDIARREAELEAALSADFSSQAESPTNTSASGSDTSGNDVTSVTNNNAEAPATAQVLDTAEAPNTAEAPSTAEALNTAEALITEEAKPKPEETETLGYHVVVPGENLYRISIQYNVKMESLMRWNDLDDPGVKIGMKLWVKDPNNND